MFWLISLFFRGVSALVGTALAVLMLAAGVGAFALGGAPKQYEIDALGVAYSNALEAVEGAARDLRQDYCTRADSESQHEARCAAPVA